MIVFTVSATVAVVIMIIGFVAWMSSGYGAVRDRKKSQANRQGWRDTMEHED